MPESVTVALSAIPNTGKSTLFNRLTGANQSTGNWPGVSVEKKVGYFDLGEYRVELVDLPGAYSLSPVSEEERVVRDFFLHTPPDVVLNLLDARNLYRGLGLTLQMACSGLPLVIAVNMIDEARRQGLVIDVDVLAAHLGAPVVPISAHSGEGLPALLDALYRVIREPHRSRPPHISFSPVLEEAIGDLARKLERDSVEKRLDPNFLAARLLEGDVSAELEARPELATPVHKWRQRVERAMGLDIATSCAGCRFNAARGLVMEATHAQPPPPDARGEQIDRVLLHPWLGLPLFVLLMLVLFQVVYGLGAPLQDLLAQWFDGAARSLRALPVLAQWPQWLSSLAFDGLWQGLGVVTSFFPVIALFFVCMSLIEDSGYMARAAFLMDRLMHRLDLDGKAFINLLLGYGCNVPAVMGTRILSGRHNRVLTMLLIPFSLCTARLQVFVFLTGILFPPAQAPWVLAGLYVGSFAAILLGGLLLKALRATGTPEPFIMEMPPYRLPAARSVLLRTWQELKDFLQRAATLILLGVVGVWLLTHFPADAAPGGVETWAGMGGKLLSPLFTPLGIGWQETVALLFGFIAKEILIGSMAVIYGGTDPQTAIAAAMTPLQGLSLMVFVLLYTPCVATLAAIRAESRSWKVTLASLSFGLAAAWLGSLMIYQGGRLLGFQ